MQSQTGQESELKELAEVVPSLAPNNVTETSRPDVKSSFTGQVARMKQADHRNAQGYRMLRA